MSAADKPTPDKAPGEDTGAPTLTSTGETKPTTPKNRGGRPRLSDEERARREADKAVPSSVKQAVSSLDSAYTLMAGGLLMLGAANASAQLATEADAMKQKNTDFLIANPKLAERIAKFGASTGSLGFIGTNMFMLTGVAMTASQELKAKAEERAKTAPRTDPMGGDRLSPRKVRETAQQMQTDLGETEGASPLFPGGL